MKTVVWWISLEREARPYTVEIQNSEQIKIDL